MKNIDVIHYTTVKVITLQAGFVFLQLFLYIIILTNGDGC